MRYIQAVLSVIALFFIVPVVQAQTDWLLAESIEKNNAWNKPFYEPYNNVTVLFSARTDSSAFCFDCNLASILWKGISANNIPVYMPDKKNVLTLQKNTAIKKAIEISAIKNETSVTKLIGEAICSVYRKPVGGSITDIADLPIEWLSVEFKQKDITYIYYLRAKESLAYLETYPCTWVHPVNHHVQMNYKQALVKRNYLTGKKMVVASSNLQASASLLNTVPVLAQSLIKNDTHFSAGALQNVSDTIQIYLQAMCSASSTALFNRGYNKADLPAILMQLYESKKIHAYTYHEAGYFTTLAASELPDRFLVERSDEGEYSVKRYGTASLTRIHILKKLTQLDKTNRISNEWLILGMDSTVSTAFKNTYVLAFSYPHVLEALAGKSYMWYSGINQLDSMKLEEALRTQRIAYDNMVVSTMYGDTVFYCTNGDRYREYKSATTLAAQLDGYAESLRKDFDASHNRFRIVAKQTGKQTAETYQLTYFFDANSKSALTQNTALTDLFLEAIRTKKIKTYADEQLSEIVAQDVVISKLDKARFYKTGNKRKDSIYISKIPIDERYIKGNELTQYTITASYAMHSKAASQGRVLGIFIPAVLNPQYEAEVFCYVSYTDFLQFLQKDKTGKKQVAAYTSLLNERAIISVEDFYGLSLYDAADEKPGVPGTLPPYVRERVME
jgi:hypothetical protein